MTKGWWTSAVTDFHVISSQLTILIIIHGNISKADVCYWFRIPSGIFSGQLTPLSPTSSLGTEASELKCRASGQGPEQKGAPRLKRTP